MKDLGWGVLMNKPFAKTAIPVSKYPSNFIPKDAEITTSTDYGNGGDCTCICRAIKKYGVIHIQEITYYDNNGKVICPQ